MSARGCITWISATCQFIMCALDDELRPGKGIVIPRVIHIEMSTDDEIDVVGTQAKIGKMRKHIFFVLGFRRARRERIISRHSAIDQNVLPVARLNKIATSRSRRGLRARWDN